MTATQTAGMPRYRVVVTAPLQSDLALDAGWLRAVTRGQVKVLAPDLVRITLSRRGRDAECAADRALIDINRALAPRFRFSAPPVWTARPAGLRGIGRRTAGRWHLGNGDDDGLGGVREPRRPIPPLGSASIALDLPD